MKATVRQPRRPQPRRRYERETRCDHDRNRDIGNHDHAEPAQGARVRGEKARQGGDRLEHRRDEDDRREDRSETRLRGWQQHAGGDKNDRQIGRQAADVEIGAKGAGRICELEHIDNIFVVVDDHGDRNRRRHDRQRTHQDSSHRPPGAGIFDHSCSRPRYPGSAL
jgi:hypothetical protein